MKSRSAVLVIMLLSLAFPFSSAQPQRYLRITVSGDEEATDTVHVTFSLGEKTWTESCKLRNGSCLLALSGDAPRVTAIRFTGNIAVIRATGTSEASWVPEWWMLFWQPENIITLTSTPEGVEARLNVYPRIEGGELVLDLLAARVCVVEVDVNESIQGISLDMPRRWWRRQQFNGTLTLVLPRGASFPLALEVDENTRIGKFLARLAPLGFTYQPPRGRGVSISCRVTCDDTNLSLAYLAARGVRESLETYIASETDLLRRVGFNAKAYLEDVNFSMMLIRQSEEAFQRGEAQVGVALFEKGLAKASSSLDALSQAKADSVPSFLFLLVFTLFLSLIVGNLAEKRKAVISTAVFAGLALIEITLIPYAKLALTFLDPAVLQRATPSSMILSLLTATLGLAVVAAFVLGAKGTAISDFFWYSVKSMRRRKLRSLLTVCTIAVVTSVAGAFLALGSSTLTRDETYASSFKGVSVSRHITTTMYIFRGLNQANEYIVTESYAPLTPGEVEWLAKSSWVKGVYLLKAGVTFISYNGSRAVALVAATDAKPLNGLAVSKSLARQLGIEVGSKVNIGGRSAVVVEVFEDESPPALIDGVPVNELPQIPGGRMGGVALAPLDFAPPGSQVYKVFLEGEPQKDLRDSLVRMSYTWSGNMTTQGGAQVTTYVYESYKVCSADGRNSSCLLIVGEFVQASGIPEFSIVLLLSGMTVAISLLGSTHERGKEYSTASALGASPAYVSSIVLIEGLSYGILGGVVGYVLGEFLQSLAPARVVAVKPSTFSPVLASALVAIIPSVIGSVIPARGAALKVVPSRIMLRKAAEVRIYEDMAEASIPLRITGDVEGFVEYVTSFLNKPPPVSWGPIYMRVDVKRRDGAVELIETTVSFRSERAAIYLARIYVPKGPGETVRVVATSPTGEWTVDHKACAKAFLTSLRDDLLHYVEWRKARSAKAG